MVELSTAQKAGAVTLLMILSNAVTFTLTEQPSVYYCQSRDLVYQCSRLSDSKVTCYLQDSSAKRCTEGWQPITKFIGQTTEIKPEPIMSKETPFCTPENKYKVVCKI